MKLKDIMTKEVEVIPPDATFKEAAQKMRVHDIGFLPVCDSDRVLGVITDRDIIVRSTAEGTDPNKRIGQEFFTSPMIYCFDDQDVEEAAKVMEEHQIRRLVVLNRDTKHLVGVVSLGDLATSGKEKTSAEVLQSVSEPTH
jgi:CBS domain-containing protein